MPYTVIDNAEGCSGYAVVKEGETTPVPGGCHETKQDAIDHMVALEIATEDEQRADSYAPTDGMVDEAKRGLAWRAEFGRGGTAVGVARARDIANRRNLSLDTVKRMRSYFARHEIDKDAEGFRPGEDGYPSAGRIAWALWGGDAGQAWSASILEKEGQRTDMETEQENTPRSVVYPVEGRRINGRDVEFREMPVTIDSVDETASGDQPMTFRGYAAVFDSPSEPLPFIETIAPGAFKRSLNSGREVRMFINHNSDQVLASTRSGTLQLIEDERGLYVEAELPPTTYGRDLSVMMQRGDVHSMSFGFSVPTGGDSWSDDGQSRELREVILHEVSVVTGFPAYPATNGASVRNESEVEEQRDDESADVAQDASLPLSIAQRLFDLNAKRPNR
jgi:HK97 family phage prohead protease